MKTLLSTLLLAALTALIAAPAAADVELRLPTGATWRGDVGDTVRIVFTERGVDVEHVGEVVFVSTSPAYVTIKTDIAGRMREKTIFGADIKVLEAPAATDEVERTGGRRHVPERKRRAPGSGLSATGSDDIPRDDMGRPLGVFYLPLEGGVGQEFRHDEIETLVEYVDENYGPGQTIVLFINSNGGLVMEALDIADAIWEARERHRVVAWIDKAISAGAFTAMSCNEIYFRSSGNAGSVTTVRGTQSLQGPEVEKHVEHFAELAEKSGYSEHIARAMKLNRYMVSYDKDPETGEVTFYPDLRGEFVLSTDEQNLAFDSQTAEHCGFSEGTADTPEELAKLLGLPKWYEISDKGRELAEGWKQTFERLQEDFSDIQFTMNVTAGNAPDMMTSLSIQLRQIERIIRLHDRHPRLTWLTFTRGNTPEESKRAWELVSEELRKQISDMRRRRR